MLDFIRRNAASWLIRVILGAIVIVFIFWGIGSFRSERVDVFAKVNGEKILVETYRAAYNDTIERYRQMFKGQIPQGFLEQLDIKQQVVDGLISETLLRQAARDMKLQVSNEEIQNFILAIPAFKKDGTFDQRLYERTLHSARLTTAAFEAQVRQQLLSQKLQTVLGSGLAVPDSEAKERFIYENSKVDIAYVKVDTERFDDKVETDDKDLATWYESHQEAYRTDPQIMLRYVAFKENELDGNLTISDSEIERYYNEHLDDYQKEEKRQARHILLKVPEGADETLDQETREKVESVLERLRKGEDFDKLAKEFSQDTASAAKGGDLGFFTRGTMVKPFEDAVFSMKEGELSEPVRSRFGWHIIELEKIQPAQVETLDDVKDAIAKLLRREKLKDMAWEKANEAYDEIIQLGSLQEYAKRHDVPLQTTTLFSEKTPPPLLAANPDILKGIFALDAGELSSLIQLPWGILIADVTEKKPPHIPAFEEVKADVEKGFVKERAQELCKQSADELLALAKEKGLEEAARAKGFTLEETGFFKRTDVTAGGHLPFNAVKEGLSLHEGKKYPDEAIEGPGGFFVVAFKDKEDADLEGFPAKKDDIKQRILTQKRQTVLDDWLAGLREAASIDVRAEFK
jgi:peptidyl-prolyl cis-trans isomerase D